MGPWSGQADLNKASQLPCPCSFCRVTVVNLISVDGVLQLLPHAGPLLMSLHCPLGPEVACRWLPADPKAIAVGLGWRWHRSRAGAFLNLFLDSGSVSEVPNKGREELLLAHGSHVPFPN